MAEPQDMIVPLLREMRAEIAGRFDKTDARFDRIDQRLKKLDSAQSSFTQALSRELEANK